MPHYRPVVTHIHSFAVAAVHLGIAAGLPTDCFSALVAWDLHTDPHIAAAAVVVAAAAAAGKDCNCHNIHHHLHRDLQPSPPL